MFNLIKKLFRSEEKVSEQLKKSEGPSLKWPSPIAQKVLDDLDKCPAWEWHTDSVFHPPFNFETIRFRQHPYLNYQLDSNFSIEGISLNNKDELLIKAKFLSQLSSYRKSLQLVKIKENLDQLGFDYEAVKPWLTQYQ